MKKKFKCQGTYDYLKDSDYEVSSGVSMTVPDENMSISEILDKFAHGISPNIVLGDYYSDTDDFDDHDPIINDLTDLDDIKNELIDKYNIIEEHRKRKNEKAPDYVPEVEETKTEGEYKAPSNDAQ
nr:MAG: hypothetical protein [Microviridae sp.]